MPTKVKRLKKIAREHKKVAFVVETPHSERGLPVQSVTLKNFEVRKTRGGHYVIVGREIQLEKLRDKITQDPPPAEKKRKKKQMMFRAFRIDRILDRTITTN